MLVASAVLIGLAHLTGATTPSIAIIGAGAGGSSAAYFISLAKQRIASNCRIDITVFDKNTYVGGRSTVVYPYNNPSLPAIELGASIFTGNNKNMMRAVSDFGFELVEKGGGIPGVWNGNQFLFKPNGNDTDDNNRLQSRYGNGPMVTYGLSSNFLSSFAKNYAPSFPTFQSIAQYSSSLGFTSLQTISLQTYLDNNGANKLWTREFESGSTRINYSQDADAIQAVAGMASISADSAYSVKGGNYKVFQQFLNKSGAKVKLGTTIRKIAKVGSRYLVTPSVGAPTFYDGVIIATPIPLSGITFENLPQISTIPRVDYLHLHVTLISTTTPSVLPAYFKAAAPIPGTIITAKAGGDPQFFGLQCETSIQRNGTTEYIYKVFSKALIPNSTLETWFGKGKLGWVYRKEWDAYPYFPARTSFPPVKIDNGMYYVNAMEGLLSTMETEIISSRNIVDSAAKELIGGGICGLAKAKGPASDTYVYGWDC